jgi:hypothetical protein
MSFQITEAFVNQFADNFKHVAQQMMSRFEGKTLVESGIVGASKSINRLGKRTAKKRTVRHADTPINDQPHSTRFIDLTDWEDGDMVDDQDKIRMLVDPTSDYVRAMVQSLNRAKDDVCIEAALSTARVTGGTAALSAGQIIAVGGTGMTKAKLIQARALFRQNEADEEDGEELYIAYGHTQLSDLLSDTTLTNTEYQTVMSMMGGSFAGAKLFGFTPVPTERLTLTATTRKCFAWAKSGLSQGVGQDIVSRVGEDPGKSFNIRVYAKMSIGAVRVEEEKVVEIDCLDS